MSPASTIPLLERAGLLQVEGLSRRRQTGVELPSHRSKDRRFTVYAYTAVPESVLVGGLTMQTKTIIEGVVLVLVVAAAIAMLPDFVRYMKIRAM